MTDLERLLARLARLADAPEPVRGGARVLAVEGRPDPLAAMQREVEETQMPRSLRFCNDRDDLLVLHVKAGRIAVVADAPQCLGPERDIVGVDLSGADASHKDRLSKVLGGFLEGAAGLTVRSGLRAPDISPAVTGVCPGECFLPSGAAEQGTAPAVAPGDLGGFLSACADVATAWVWVQGAEICDHDGAPERVQRLSALAQNELAERAALSPAPDDARCVIISGAGPQADAILSGSFGAGLVFVSFPASEVAEVLRLWRDCMA